MNGGGIGSCELQGSLNFKIHSNQNKQSDSLPSQVMERSRARRRTSRGRSRLCGGCPMLVFTSASIHTSHVCSIRSIQVDVFVKDDHELSVNTSGNPYLSFCSD